jgi:hypothetical protein
MKEYHKIQSLFKRDNSKRLIVGDYSIPEFRYLQNNIWNFTEKINGTNICIKWNNNCISFGNPGSQIPVPLINYCGEKVFSKIDLFEEMFKDKEVEMYFEGYGKGIQENDGSRYLPNGVSIILIDINIDGWWLNNISKQMIAKKFNFNIVPNIGSGTLKEMLENVKNGFISNLENLPAEGIVAKPEEELYTRSGERIITKLKYLDFPPEERGKLKF